MSFKKVYRPQAGDLVRVRRKQGYAHFGIATSPFSIIHYSDYGSDSVLDASKVRVIETSLDIFLADGYCEKIKPFDSPYTPEEVVERAKELLGTRRFRNKTYNVVSNNCEHFARYVYYGNAESKQVETATKVAVGAASVLTAAVSMIVSVVNNNKKKKKSSKPLEIESKEVKQITKKK